MTARTAQDKAPRPGANQLHARLATRQQPIVVGVAGDSGSGKSTYTQGLERLLGAERVSQISLDGYHAEDRATRRLSGRTPLDPDANHLDQAVDHLQRLRAGEAVEIPVYDHATGRFQPPRRHSPTPVVVVEGLHTLYPEFRPLLDFSVYVDTAAAVKREWKHHRDTRERGYAPSDADAEISRRASQYERWIAGQQDVADVILRIHPSELGRLALGRLDADVQETCYHLEVIVEPRDDDLQSLFLPVDLSNMTRQHAMPFMLATVPSHFRGRAVNVLHVDGYMAPAALETLEQAICAFAGLDAPAGERTDEPLRPATVRFAQMLVAWPVLTRVSALAD
ncbi:phosphoribulokinase [Spiribacter insolitus]|uniref:phosphoribulokinase n=1 Tax=Spiribacter insolitus TaxID=3122417 RepID=A0ABV3T4L7_9GAMM